MTAMAPDSQSVKWLCYKPDNWEAVVQFLSVATDFSLLQNIQTGFGTHRAYCSMGTWASFSEDKVAEVWNIIPPPTSIEVQKEWSSTSNTPNAFMVCSDYFYQRNGLYNKKQRRLQFPMLPCKYNLFLHILLHSEQKIIVMTAKYGPSVSHFIRILFRKPNITKSVNTQHKK